MTVDLQRKRDLGSILDDSFSLYRAHWRTLLALAAVVVVPVQLLVYGVGLGWLWEGYPDTTDTADLGDLGEQLGGLVAQVLVVTPLVTAMTVHTVLAAADGRTPAVGEGLRAGFDVFTRLLGAILLMAAGVALGFLALVVPGIWLAVRWVVVPQSVVVEGRGGTDALRRSYELTRDRWWFSFLVLLVANLLVGLLTAIVLLPLELAAEGADSMALSLLGQILGSLFSLPLLAVAYTLLYFSLLAERGGLPPGAAPGPPSPADGPAGPSEPQSMEGVPGTFGGFAPPTPPPRGPEPPS